MAAIELKPVLTDTRDGFVIVSLKDSAGRDYEVKLNTIDTASLVGSLRAQIVEAIPKAESMGLPGMTRVQYVETPENIFFRVFLSEHLYHEYPVPKGTTLADDLKYFGDRVEARNLAKATHQPPDNPSGRH
jgi:hypothetical protein